MWYYNFYISQKYLLFNEILYPFYLNFIYENTLYIVFITSLWVETKLIG